MHIPPQARWLMVRQHPPEAYTGGNSKRDNGNNSNVVIIIAVTIVFSFTFIVMVYFVLRSIRRMNCRPKYLPGKFLKDRWNRWNAGVAYGQVPNESNPNQASGNPSAERGNEMNTTNNAIRRDTSIRSIITLPAYSPNPKPEEQIIAREGERGGMDVVVEFPETGEEEEARREDLMESLYQVRLHRREEIAERAARRQERREARARGDYARLEELRREAHARANSRMSPNGSNTNLTAAMALAEQQMRGRDRRVSAVNYAELGQVRHDGSRVRTSSHDSDRHPLLSGSTANVDNISNRSSFADVPSLHSRGESYSSIISESTATSNMDSLTPVQSHAQSTHSIIPSSGVDDGDVGTLRIPPPHYDNLEWGEAPPYESPVSEHAPRLRELIPLPTIHIDAASPISDTPATPPPLHEEEQSTPTESSSHPHS